MPQRSGAGMGTNHSIVALQLIMKLASHLAQREGVHLDWISLLPDGSLDLAHARALITPEVSLVSVMAANNETGVLMPIGELARLAHAQGLRHTRDMALAQQVRKDFVALSAQQDKAMAAAMICLASKGCSGLYCSKASILRAAGT